jgi:hypothetical protein
VTPWFNGPVHAAISVGALNAKSANCAPLGPVIPLTAKVGSAIATCPAFVTCTVNAALESPISAVPRFTDAGRTASIGADNPVPLSVAGAEATPRVLVATVSVAVVAPTATGENNT